MLVVGKQFTENMIAHSLEEDPNECCGILAGNADRVQRLYRITNVAKSPYRYEMDSQEVLEATLDCERHGMEVIAYYHSHTHSPAKPSPTDVRLAQQSGYLDEYYVLVSLERKDPPDIRTFLIHQPHDCVDQPHEYTEQEMRIC